METLHHYSSERNRMQLSDVIQMYLADRQAKGIAPATRRNDQQTLRLLLADVGNISTKHLKPQHLDLFWSRRESWSPGTMNRSRFILSTFFKWCQARGHVSRNLDLLEGHRKLKVAPRARVTIPQDEFETFLEGIEDPRHRIVAALGLYLFVRVSEIQCLRWQDVRLEDSEVEVYRPKTNTLDTLPICAELAREIQRWHREYAAAAGQQLWPSWFLVPGLSRGGYRGTPGQKGLTLHTPAVYMPLQKSRLNRVVTKILEDAGYFRPQEGGHTLRRSGAIALYNQLASVGHDRAIRVCQAMLGHSSISTTEVYLRLDLDRKVRNDLLAGKPMFPETTDAAVIQIGVKESRSL